MQTEDRQLLDARGRPYEDRSPPTPTHKIARSLWLKLRAAATKLLIATGLLGVIISASSVYLAERSRAEGLRERHTAAAATIEFQYWVGPKPAELRTPRSDVGQLPEGIQDLSLVQSVGDWYTTGPINSDQVKCKGDGCQLLSSSDAEGHHGTVFLIARNTSAVTMNNVTIDWHPVQPEPVVANDIRSILTNDDSTNLADYSESLIDLPPNSGLLIPIATVLIYPIDILSIALVPVGQARLPVGLDYRLASSDQSYTVPVRAPSGSIVVGGFSTDVPFQGGG